jgi:DNA-binding NarL/FixJ family response regulator
LPTITPCSAKVCGKFWNLIPPFKIVGEAKDGVEAVHLAAKLKPQMLLLDLQMPRQSGSTGTPTLSPVTASTTPSGI